MLSVSLLLPVSIFTFSGKSNVFGEVGYPHYFQVHEMKPSRFCPKRGTRIAQYIFGITSSSNRV